MAGRPDPSPHGRRLARTGHTDVPGSVGTSRWSLPHPSTADEDGVVGVGADLAPPTLVHAYRTGLFPWPHDDAPLPWFSPNPRALLGIDDVHVSRSLARRMRTSGWTTTVDAAFTDVIRGCAIGRDDGTWITDEMLRAYTRLHDVGWAHSVEVWDGDDLVGGIYGIQVGRVFTGESMFHRADDASKVALVELLLRHTEGGGVVVDTQLATPHLRRMGAREVSRELFLWLLERGRDVHCPLLLDRLPVEGMPARLDRLRGPATAR